MAEPLTFGGIPLIVDENLPEGVCYLIQYPPMLPNETLTQYRERQFREGVMIVNLERADG